MYTLLRSDKDFSSDEVVKSAKKLMKAAAHVIDEIIGTAVQGFLFCSHTLAFLLVIYLIQRMADCTFNDTKAFLPRGERPHATRGRCKRPR